MLWNWYTVDSCFLSRSWHNTSKGMFAGSCIGVILLVMVLEFLRRAGKEYDRYIIAKHTKKLESAASSRMSTSDTDSNTKALTAGSNLDPAGCAPTMRFRPTIVQQLTRALLHMLQFAVAYFVMLLAMYYNGYIIICIFIGAFLGYAVFSYESFNIKMGGRDRIPENTTVCCG